jgi:hypothetical protein
MLEEEVGVEERNHPFARDVHSTRLFLSCLPNRQLLSSLQRPHTNLFNSSKTSL